MMLLNGGGQFRLKFRKFVTDSNNELYWIYGPSYQIKEPSFSQNLYQASPDNRLTEHPQ